MIVERQTTSTVKGGNITPIINFNVFVLLGGRIIIPAIPANQKIIINKPNQRISRLPQKLKCS